MKFILHISKILAMRVLRAVCWDLTNKRISTKKKVDHHIIFDTWKFAARILSVGAAYRPVTTKALQTVKQQDKNKYTDEYNQRAVYEL